jgi:zinc protease
MKRQTRPTHDGAAKSFDLDGGSKLLLVEDHALPLVSMTFAFRSGSAHDPAGKEGASRLAMRMLRRGAGDLGAKEIEDAIDRLGAEVGSDVTASGSSFGAQVIRRNLDPFVELLGKMLGSPTFPRTELERLRRETVAEIIESRDNDRALAQRALRRSLFAGHLYGRPTSGTTQSVETLGEEDARAAYGLHVRRGNLVIGMCGDVDEDTAKAVASRVAAAVPDGPALPDPIVEPEPKMGRRLVFVDKPERTQTQILVGTLGTSPFDADHVPLGVANAVFGGTFTSRLMREVRSKRGWSYGAAARLATDRHRQSFSMWTFPAAIDAAACLRLELEMLEAFVSEGITKRELSFVRSYLTRSHAFEVDTASKRLHQALDVAALDLPADYHTSYLPKVKATSLEAANGAVKERLHPGDLQIVVVGTASTTLDGVVGAIDRLDGHTVVPFDAD